MTMTEATEAQLTHVNERGGEIKEKSIEDILLMLEEKGAEVFGVRDGNLIEAMVPMGMIDQSEVAVDEGHVVELAESMKEEKGKGVAGGQLNAVLLAHVLQQDDLSILDGFHRTAALERTQHDKIFATIRINTSLEEVGDLRILTANSHSSVSFSRIHAWVSDAWSKTPWSNRIDAAQAFSIANNKKQSGRNLGLSQEETDAVRAWTLQKCEQWHVSAFKIYDVMRISEAADPDLVQQARSRASGHELLALTPIHLREIALTYPGHHDIQNALSVVVISNNLTVPETKKLLELLVGIDIDSVLGTVQHTDWAEFFKTERAAIAQSKPKRTRPGRNSPKQAQTEAKPVSHNERRFQPLYLESTVELSRLALTNVVYSGQYLVPPSTDPRPPLFSVDMAGNRHALELIQPIKPELAAGTEEAFLDRFEQLQNRLEAIVREQTDASEDDARRIVRNVGERVGRDLRDGALQFVQLVRRQNYDDLIRQCLEDEMNKYRANQPEPFSYLHQQGPGFHLSTAQEVLPTFDSSTRKIVTLMGMMGVQLHTIAQVIDVSQAETTQRAEVARTRLIAARRIQAQTAKAEKEYVESLNNRQSA